jgi:hypothetical protein
MRGGMVSKAMATRRERKNAQTRVREEGRKGKVSTIRLMPEHERTEEEQEQLELFEATRLKKNKRSQRRIDEQKEEIDRILAISEGQRTDNENNYIDMILYRKMRKNEGDRLRRKRKKLGDRENPQLKPLPKKSHVLTTVHLQMSKINQDYTLHEGTTTGEGHGARGEQQGMVPPRSTKETATQKSEHHQEVRSPADQLDAMFREELSMTFESIKNTAAPISMHPGAMMPPLLPLLNGVTMTHNPAFSSYHPCFDHRLAAASVASRSQPFVPGYYHGGPASVFQHYHPPWEPHIHTSSFLLPKTYIQGGSPSSQLLDQPQRREQIDIPVLQVFQQYNPRWDLPTMQTSPFPPKTYIQGDPYSRLLDQPQRREQIDIPVLQVFQQYNPRWDLPTMQTSPFPPKTYIQGDPYSLLLAQPAQRREQIDIPVLQPGKTEHVDKKKEAYTTNEDRGEGEPGNSDTGETHQQEQVDKVAELDGED